MTDRYDLQRFVDAQDEHYESVLEELRSGRKRSHWMWYVFPQLRGLGGSAMSWTYAIASQDEARAYWEHAVLGSRLRECTQLVIDVQGRTVEQVFSYPDHLKFHSCLTLFERSVADPAIFRTALLKYFDGKPDQLTLVLLEGHQGQPACQLCRSRIDSLTVIVKIMKEPGAEITQEDAQRIRDFCGHFWGVARREVMD